MDRLVRAMMLPKASCVRFRAIRHSTSRLAVAAAMLVAGIFAWLSKVREGEATGIAGPYKWVRWTRRQSSPGLSPGVAGSGDNHPGDCHVASWGQATSTVVILVCG